MEKMVKIPVQWGNGQLRTFSILISDPFVLLCEFDNEEWCYWIKDSSIRGGWKLGENSRGDGEGRNCPANPNFVPILDRMYEQLACDEAVDKVILGDE